MFTTRVMNDMKHFFVRGITIKMPFTPYRSQLGIINSVIKGLCENQNVLIESPTGTGKTFALLCSTISWQQNEKEKLVKAEECDSDSSSPAKQPAPRCRKQIPKIYYCSRTHFQLQQVCNELKEKLTDFNLYPDLRMSILSSREHSCLNKKKIRELYNSDGQKALSLACSEMVNNYTMERYSLTNNFDNNHHHKLNSNQTPKCPYFNKNIEMTIGSYSFMRKSNFPVAYDIDDYLELGRSCKSCPFYGQRSLMNEADIIFCPYNYVIDPNIRSSLGINLNNAIVIFDEAHNIEDFSRSVFDLEIINDQLSIVVREIDQVCKLYKETDMIVHDKFLELYIFLQTIVNWLNSYQHVRNESYFKNNHPKKKEFAHCVKGEELRQLLVEKFHFNRKYLEKVNDSFAYINELKSNISERLNKLGSSNELKLTNDDGSNKNFLFPDISPVSKEYIKSILNVLSFIIDSKTCKCFTVTIKNTLSFSGSGSNPGSDEENSNFTRKRNKNESSYFNNKNSGSSVYDAYFNCLDSALSFELVSRQTKSVILASGTLAPLSSFSAELNTPFQVLFKTFHKIPHDRLAVCGLSVDRKNRNMTFNFAESKKFDRQDRLGEVILDITRVVPNGMLCFFPSYNMMNSMLGRWQQVGILDKIEKKVFIEGKANKLDSAMMNKYARCSNESAGAVFFGVCRGRNSEGMDFRNELARAVVMVGIPYPNISSNEVQQKIEYNDRRLQEYRQKHDGGGKENEECPFLPGRNWYTTQAYRALNQAIGRCIRHNEDWGSVIFLDSRYCANNGNNPHVRNISKWAAENFVAHDNYRNFLDDISYFYQRRYEQHVVTDDMDKAEKKFDKEKKAFKSER